MLDRVKKHQPTCTLGFLWCITYLDSLRCTLRSNNKWKSRQSRPREDSRSPQQKTRVSSSCFHPHAHKNVRWYHTCNVEVITHAHRTGRTIVPPATITPRRPRTARLAWHPPPPPRLRPPPSGRSRSTNRAHTERCGGGPTTKKSSVCTPAVIEGFTQSYNLKLIRLCCGFFKSIFHDQVRQRRKTKATVSTRSTQITVRSKMCVTGII